MRFKATPLGIEDPLMLAAVAAELEARAVARFGRLMDIAEKEGRSDLKSLFSRLRQEEETHRTMILETMTEDGELPDITPKLMANLGLKMEVGESNHLSGGLYEALASAVRSEEKAFAFFSSVAAYAHTDAVRKLAESLAAEELEHAALLRHARRAAYHRARSKEKRWPVEVTFDSKEEFLAGVRAAEAQFLGSLMPWITSDPALQIILDVTKGALDLPAKTIKSAPKNKLTGTQKPETLEVLRATLNEAQIAFDYYDCVTSRCGRADVLAEAQSLSKMALDRISTLCTAIAKASTRALSD